MLIFNSFLGTYANLSMDQINALIAMLALGVAGLAVYLALVAIRGKKR